jgi:hypothetical protein
MKTIKHDFEFVVVGGGLAGICAAVTAARQGVRTALVQDRPVLGGNSSKEIRVPPVGATNCNFAYSRETGLLEELFLNNLYRNVTWSAEGWDLELQTLVRNEPNLELFLNTSLCDAEMKDGRIICAKGYCVTSETWHHFIAAYYADCTGDGTLGAAAGARFRRGVEAKAEFNEAMCPEQPEDVTMGSSIQMHAHDVGREMPFVKPAWVKLELNESDFGPWRPVTRNFFPDTGGFWWLEWGGALDTIHDAEQIRDEVQKILLATWDYLKNRSELSERLKTYQLDWVGAVAGKRENRRFEGDHILTVNDIDAQRAFEDAVAFGGWGIDHHPAGGFYDNINPSTHQYLRGPHNIPLRCLYSRNVENLYMAGRNLSASHYALSSTRVMNTCAQLGEAVGMAASFSVRLSKPPRELVADGYMAGLQQALHQADHHICGMQARLDNDLAPEAQVTASSTFSTVCELASWGTEALDGRRMLKFPVLTETLERVSLRVDAREATQLRYALHNGPDNDSTYPVQCLAEGAVAVGAGQGQWIELPLACPLPKPGWHFLLVEANPALSLHLCEMPPGFRRYYPRPEDPIRPDPFSSWTARSLPVGMTRAVDADGAAVTVPVWSDEARKNAALSCFVNVAYGVRLSPEQPAYQPGMAVNPYSRPTAQPNLWVSAPSDFSTPETLTLTWEQPRSIRAIQLLFDSALHFHFWQSWQGYAVNAIPTLVKDYRLVATLAEGTEVVVAEARNNYQRNCSHRAKLDNVKQLRLECLSTNGIDRAQVYALRVLGQEAKE